MSPSGTPKPDYLEYLGKVLSLLSGALPILEKWFNLFPCLNPAVRADVLYLSVFLAAFFGIVFHEIARHFRKGLLICLLGVGLVLVSVVMLIMLINDVSLGFQPATVSTLLRVLYALMFAFLGLAVGGVSAL